MPHELSTVQGDSGNRVEMMYTGDTPWHGLGTRLDNPATALEAIQAAHLDWTVESSPIYSHGGEVPGYQAIYRADTGKIFGIVTDHYEIVQNGDSWTFMDTILGPGKAHYHTAGALRDGSVVWILAKLDGTVEIVKDDPVEKYLLLVTSHDGSLALQIHTTPIRVVCGNTMTAALARGRQYVAIKHTTNVHRRIEEAQKALAQGETYFGDMILEAKLFSHQPMSERDMAAFTQALLHINPNATKKLHVHTEAAERDINELFIMGRGQDNPLVRGTAWAAYNAVTEYIDYQSYVQPGYGSVFQGSIQSQDRRLYRSWFGKGQSIRNAAWKLLQNHRQMGIKAFDRPIQSQITQYSESFFGGDDADTARI